MGLQYIAQFSVDSRLLANLFQFGPGTAFNHFQADRGEAFSSKKLATPSAECSDLARLKEQRLSICFGAIGM